MDNAEKENLAIVPYEPMRTKEDKYNRIIENGFNSKRKAYICFFFLGLFGFFMAFCLEKRLSNETMRFASVFSDLISADGVKFYANSGTRFLLVSTLAMFISSFTVFSPAVAVAYFVFFSFNAGFYCSSLNGFIQYSTLTIFVIASLVYSVEIMSAYARAKYGVRQIFKPNNIISVSTATLSYTAFILLYAYCINL